jgi:hypothetical protein
MKSGKLTETVTILKKSVKKNGFGEEEESLTESGTVYLGVNSLSGSYKQVEGVSVQDYDVVFMGRWYLMSSGKISDGTILRWRGHDYRVESIGITSDSRIKDIVSFKCNRINQ